MPNPIYLLDHNGNPATCVICKNFILRSDGEARTGDDYYCLKCSGVKEKPIGFGFTSVGSLKEPRIKWLIKDILPAGVMTFMSAVAKHGKSTLAMHIATCLSTGKPFLGRFSLGRRKPYKVLYIPLEDHRGEIKAKVKNFIGKKRMPLRFKVLNTQALSLPNDMDKLKVDIQQGGFDLVILDTLRRSHDAEEDSSSKMSPIINGLKGVVNTFKLTVIIIHHAGHNIDDWDNSAKYLRGTSDLNGSWETLIALQKLKDSIVLRAFHRYRSTVKLTYKVVRGQDIDKSTGDFPIVDLVYVPPDESQYRQTEEALKEALKKAPQSANKLQELTGQPRARIDEVLGMLSDKGRINQVGKGRNSKWQLTN